MRRPQAYWICQISGWSLYATTRILLSTFFRDLTWKAVVINVVFAVMGIVYTHLYRLVAKRRRWTRMSLKKLAPRVLIAALIVSAANHFTLDGIGRYVLELSFYDDIESEVGMTLASIANGWFLIMVWSLIYFGVHAVWNYRQAEVEKWKLEAQAEAARLQALKLQLNPHFFFNSLNSLRALITEDPSRAQQMVTRLARLLRTTLQMDDVKTVSLDEELSTVRTYLALEQVRFEDRLQYEIEASDEARTRPVPFLLVQTLVENGIKHGIATRPGGGTITVRAGLEDEGLRVQVTNPGTVDSEEGGIGLENARERLQLLFGDHASLSLENDGPNTVVATAVLPAREPSARALKNGPVNTAEELAP